MFSSKEKCYFYIEIVDRWEYSSGINDFDI